MKTTNSTDRTYLSRSLVPNTNYIITNEKVKITNPCTIHCEISVTIPIAAQAELLIKRTQIVKKAKEYNIKVTSKNAFKTTIVNRWSEYSTAIVEVKTLYQLIKTQAKLVRKRGIHSGYCDDEELNTLMKLCYEYEKYFYRGTVVSVFHDISDALNYLIDDLDNFETEYCAICL